MLSFDIRSLATKAVAVDGRLEPDDPVWEEGDPRPVDGVRVTGRLSTAGAGRVFFHGHLSGTAPGECRRCLKDVTTPVREGLDLLFVDADSEEADEPDVFTIDPRAGELDLRPAVREHWLLAAPSFAQCSEDCRGLCPTCGADRNAGDCGCAPATADSRWDALRSARDERS